jgi:hypothetical protein
MSDLLTPRQYLVSKGLAVEFGKDGVSPARGKFSAAGHAELERAKAAGMKFAEPVKPAAKAKAPKPAVARPAAPEPKPLARAATADVARAIVTPPVVREQRTLYVTSDLGNGKTVQIGFDRCFRPGCFQTVSRCACAQGPKAPGGAVASQYATL